MVNFGFFFFLALLEPMSTCIDGKLLSTLSSYFADIVERGERYNFSVCSIACNREFDTSLFAQLFSLSLSKWILSFCQIQDDYFITLNYLNVLPYDNGYIFNRLSFFNRFSLLSAYRKHIPPILKIL